MPTGSVARAHLLQHGFILGIDINPEVILSCYGGRVHVVDVYGGKQNTIVSLNVREAGFPSRQPTELGHGTRRIRSSILAYRPAKLVPQRLVSTGEPRTNVSVELVCLVAIELVHVVGNIEHALRQTDHHSRDKQGFGEPVDSRESSTGHQIDSCDSGAP